MFRRGSLAGTALFELGQPTNGRKALTTYVVDTDDLSRGPHILLVVQSKGRYPSAQKPKPVFSR